MTVQEIIEAIKNDNLRSNVPFHFVTLGKDKNDIVEYGKSSCLEDEIYMLMHHMEAVRTICARNGKLLGYGDGVNFNDRTEWITFLTMLYAATVCTGEYEELFNTDSAKTSVMRLPK
jgi:hypothetical protein